MRLVIFVNTSFHLNSLNITVSVSVCYVSGSKVNRRKGAVRLCLCVFVFHLAKYINLGAFCSVASVSCLESETGLGSLCGSQCKLQGGECRKQKDLRSKNI